MKQKTFAYLGHPETGVWTVCDKYKIKKIHIQGLPGQEFNFYSKELKGIVGRVIIGLSSCYDLDISNMDYYIDKITSNITSKIPANRYCNVTIFYE